MLEITMIEAQLKKAQRHAWFCPQIQGLCEHDCYCYVAPKRHIKSDGSEVITKAYCTYVLHQTSIHVVNNYTFEMR